MQVSGQHLTGRLFARSCGPIDTKFKRTIPSRRCDQILIVIVIVMFFSLIVIVMVSASPVGPGLGVTVIVSARVAPAARSIAVAFSGVAAASSRFIAGFRSSVSRIAIAS